MRAFLTAVTVILMATGCQSKSERRATTEFDRAIAAQDAKYPILSDAALIAAFDRHRATFEQLHEMIVSDSKLHRVDEDWTDPAVPAEAGVSPGRVAEYRRLLEAIECRRGFAAYPARPGIYFISGCHGLAVAGSTKGYCYLEAAPAASVTNTATWRPAHAGDDYEVFRHIEGHWYVYFDCF